MFIYPILILISGSDIYSDHSTLCGKEVLIFNITFDLAAFRQGIKNVNFGDIDQLMQMTDRLEKLEDRLLDAGDVPTFTDINNGGLEASVQQARLAVVNKLLWLNTRAKLLTGTPFIKGIVDKSDPESILFCCDVWMAAREML